jgi:PAT family beta-lactamase induction signal transducer AmpG
MSDTAPGKLLSFSMNLILAEQRTLRFLSFAIFYVAQGLPIGLISIALPAWLAEQHVEPAHIATFLAISGLPWGFKLVAGPIMDRFSFLPMGRRRPWVIGAQFVLLASMVAMGFIPDPANNVTLLTWVAFAVNCGASVQDVAVDGMAIDVLPFDERGRANAFMAFGQVAGYSVSGALSASLLIWLGISGAAWILSIGIGFIFLWALLIRERQHERVLPWSAGRASDRSIELQAEDWFSIFRNLLRVMFLPASIVLVTMTFCWRVSGGFWITAAPVIAVQQLGYESTQYSQWTAGAGFAAATLGLLLGPLISFIAIHMDVCWTRVSATQFAIYMAWSNLARSIGAWIYGKVEPSLTSNQVFYSMSLMCVAGVVLLMVLRLRDHERRIDRLELAEAGSLGA